MPPLAPPEQLLPPQAHTSMAAKPGRLSNVASMMPPSDASENVTDVAFGLIPKPQPVKRTLLAAVRGTPLSVDVLFRTTWSVSDDELNPLVIDRLPDAVNTTPPPSFWEITKLIGELSVLMIRALAPLDISAEKTSPTKLRIMRRMVSYSFPLAYL